MAASNGPILLSPLPAVTPNSVAWPRSVLTSSVRWATRLARTFKTMLRACCMAHFTVDCSSPLAPVFTNLTTQAKRHARSENRRENYRFGTRTHNLKAVPPNMRDAHSYMSISRLAACPYLFNAGIIQSG
jgi:hypothetical protein